MSEQHIFPIFEQMLSRKEREQKLNQRAKAIWLTGLSGSGKSTIAIQLERKLFEAGFLVQLIDGDNLRSGLCKNLQFSEAERTENIRRTAELTKLYLYSGMITLNTFVSPTTALRSLAKQIVGNEDFVLIYVKASLSLCEKRDVKGLYVKARQGEIKNFTGIDQIYEVPEDADLVLDTELDSIEESVEKLYQFVLPLIRF